MSADRTAVRDALDRTKIRNALVKALHRVGGKAWEELCEALAIPPYDGGGIFDASCRIADALLAAPVRVDAPRVAEAREAVLHLRQNGAHRCSGQHPSYPCEKCVSTVDALIAAVRAEVGSRPAAPSGEAGEPEAWAVTCDGGKVESGRLWHDRELAETFRTHASRSRLHTYELVALYRRPPAPSGGEG